MKLKKQLSFVMAGALAGSVLFTVPVFADENCSHAYADGSSAVRHEISEPGQGTYGYDEEYCKICGDYLGFQYINALPVPGHWESNTNGWWYSLDRGSYYVDGLAYCNDGYYFFDNKGYLQTGWQGKYYEWSDGGKGYEWNYMDTTTGKMLTGWLLDRGNWYYLDFPYGFMSTGWEYINDEWYYFDGVTGAMQTGWIGLNNKWYYLKDNGAMVTEWLKDGNDWYLLNGDGAMFSNTWVDYYGTWYLFDTSGVMQTGWVNANGSWYYLNEDGAMLQNTWANIDGKSYYMTASGAMAVSTTTPDGYQVGADGAWVK